MLMSMHESFDLMCAHVSLLVQGSKTGHPRKWAVLMCSCL